MSAEYLMRQQIINPRIYQDSGFTLSFNNKACIAIGIQAIPGTQFYFNDQDEDIITMGPSGIYQLNFSEPIIEYITFTKIISGQAIIVDYILDDVVEEQEGE